MWKSAMAALAAAAMFGPCLAQTQSSEFDEGMQTLWEVLWHQSGTPTRLVRWEQDIKVRIFGVHLAAHKAWALQALRDVANEAGVKVIDVSGQPDAAQVANVSIEITPNNMLEDAQPCVTYLNFRTETKIDSAAMQVRDRDAWRCAYHEAMHVMGVRGHPAGKTVLSYFPVKVDGLLPLDKVMLHAWYSPKMRGGMTPFEAMPVLGEELAKTMPDPDQALQDRDRFLAQIVDQSEQFADGQGDVPMIIKRSGKATVDGIRFGRREMSYFLGVAFLEGTSVPQDATMAVKWLQQAANMGSRTAQARLGAATAR
jgi:hypothetical protein